jgi:hypothetical protein
MTTEVFEGPNDYSIAGVGPYSIDHEYTEGAIVPVVLLDTGEVELTADDFTLDPVFGDAGNVYLTEAVAEQYAGETILLRRTTILEQGWVGQGGAREAGLAAQLDRTVQRVQELEDEHQWFPRIPTLAGVRNPTLPVPVPDAGLIGNPAGDGWIAGDPTDHVVIVADTTFRIPTDFPDATEALKAIQRYSIRNNAKISIVHEDGTTITTGAQSEGTALPNVRMAAATGDGDIASLGENETLISLKSSTGFRLDSLVDLQGTGKNGIEVTCGGMIVFGAGTGVKNAGADGDDPNGAAVLINQSRAVVDYDPTAPKPGIVVSGAKRRGVWVTIGGNYSGKFGEFLGIGTDPAISEGEAGGLISRNGKFYDDNAVFLGSVRGLRNGGGDGQLRDSDLSDILGNALWTFFGGITRTEQCIFKRSGWHGDWSVYGSNFSARLDVSGEETATTGIALGLGGYRMVLIGTGGDELIDYPLVEPFDFTAGREKTELALDITDVTTLMPVDNGAQLPSAGNFVVKVGSERMLVTSRSGNMLTVVREHDGTTKAAHSSGDVVALYGTALDGAIDDSTTLIPVHDVSILPPAAAGPYLLTIGSERVRVTDISGSSLVVARGQDGTTAAAHDDLDAVSMYAKRQDISAREATPTGVTWGDDEESIYIVGTSSDQVHQFSVFAAGDLTSSFSYVRSLSLSAPNPQGLRFNKTGTRLYVLYVTEIHEFALSTAWDISTATYTDSLDLAGTVTNARGFDLNEDGDRLYVADQGDDRLKEFDLGAADDISTAVYKRYDYLKSPGAGNLYAAGTISDFCFPSATRMFFTGESSDDVDHVFKNVTWDYAVAYVGGPQADQAQGGGQIIMDRPTLDGALWTIAEVDTPLGSIGLEDVVSAIDLMGPVATITAGEVTAGGSPFKAAANSKAPHMVLISDFGKFEGTGCTLDGSGVVPYLVAVTEGGRAFLRGARLKAPGTKMFDFRAGGGSIYLHDNIINDVENCFPNGVWLGDNAVFSTFAEAELAISLGFNLAKGKGFRVGAYKFEFDPSAGDPISRLPGAVPAGKVHLYHFCDPDDADKSEAIAEFAAYTRTGRKITKHLPGGDIAIPGIVSGGHKHLWSDDDVVGNGTRFIISETDGSENTRVTFGSGDYRNFKYYFETDSGTGDAHYVHRFANVTGEGAHLQKVDFLAEADQPKAAATSTRHTTLKLSADHITLEDMTFDGIYDCIAGNIDGQAHYATIRGITFKRWASGISLKSVMDYADISDLRSVTMNVNADPDPGENLVTGASTGAKIASSNGSGSPEHMFYNAGGSVFSGMTDGMQLHDLVAEYIGQNAYKARGLSGLRLTDISAKYMNWGSAAGPNENFLHFEECYDVEVSGATGGTVDGVGSGGYIGLYLNSVQNFRGTSLALRDVDDSFIEILDTRVPGYCRDIKLKGLSTEAANKTVVRIKVSGNLGDIDITDAYIGANTGNLIELDPGYDATLDNDLDASQTYVAMSPVDDRDTIVDPSYPPDDPHGSYAILVNAEQMLVTSINSGILAADIGTSDTSIAFEAGHGFLDPATVGNYEIDLGGQHADASERETVTVTALSGNTLTVTRNASPQSFSAGDYARGNMATVTRAHDSTTATTHTASDDVKAQTTVGTIRLHGHIEAPDSLANILVATRAGEAVEVITDTHYWVGGVLLSKLDGKGRRWHYPQAKYDRTHGNSSAPIIIRGTAIVGVQGDVTPVILGTGPNSNDYGAAIGIMQTGSDPEQVGWAVYGQGSDTFGADSVLLAIFDHLGNLELPRLGKGLVLTSPDGNTSNTVKIDNNGELDTAIMPTQAAVASVTVTPTTGTLPTPDGSVTIADAAAPTNAELLEYIVELQKQVDDLKDRLQDAEILA